jgi:hypothetical protein
MRRAEPQPSRSLPAARALGALAPQYPLADEPTALELLSRPGCPACHGGAESDHRSRSMLARAVRRKVTASAPTSSIAAFPEARPPAVPPGMGGSPWLIQPTSSHLRAAARPHSEQGASCGPGLRPRWAIAVRTRLARWPATTK